ncbi:MAG: hypothetical protein JWN22_92 [Nocardioides sp.]|nr:hypothetical protein [Nocardioides sp.]
MARHLPDRLHWIVLRGFLLLLAVGGFVGVPLQLVRAWRSETLAWSGDAGVGAALPAGLFTPAPGAQATYDGHLLVSLQDPGLRLSLLSVLPDALLGAAVAIVASVLLVLVLRLQEGRPFAGNGVVLLRVAAATIAMAGVAVPLARTWANREILDRAGRLGPRLGGGPADTHYDFVNVALGWICVALLVLAVARAYREGSRLAEETEGLV